MLSLFMDRSLQTYMRLCGVFTALGLVLYVAVCFWYKKKTKMQVNEKKAGEKAYLIVFGCLGIFTLLHFVRGYVPNLQDAAYEITLGNLESGSIMTVHPFLGQLSESTMPLRMQIPGLSSLYSALITISQQSPFIILCKIVPVIVWICGLMVYRAFAKELFAEDSAKQWIFLSAVAFMFLITAHSPGMPGYRLFYAGFSGETIRSVVLLPYTLYVSWKKKWLLTAIALLAEVCLVWTTYGIGYCALIAGCMVVIHLWFDRRCRNAS